MSTKKAKLEVQGINLLKELYLDKSNRDILKEVLKYFTVRARIKISYSYIKDSSKVCNICFSSFYRNAINLDCCYKVCLKCADDHISEYSEIRHWEEKWDRNFDKLEKVEIGFSHHCKNVGTSGKRIYNIKSLVEWINNEALDDVVNNNNKGSVYLDTFYDSICSQIIYKHGKGTRCYELLWGEKEK